MSSSDEFTKALATVLKQLGVEATKGLFLWSVFKAGDNVIAPSIQRLIQSLQQGKQPSPADIEQLNRLLSQLSQQSSQQVIDYERLAAMIAERLRSQYGQPAPQPGHPYAQPPAQPVPQYQSEQIRFLQQRLQNLEQVYQELEREYWLEKDEEKRRLIKQRLDEIRNEMLEIRSKISVYV